MDKRLNEIVEAVALHYPMPKEKIMKLRAGPGESSLARYATYKLMISEGFTFRRIADFFGAKHHNVRQSVVKYEAWLGIYKPMKAKHTELETEVLK